MQSKESADIIPVLQNLCLALQPFAAKRHITLNFTSAEEKIQCCFPSNPLTTGLSKFITGMIDYMPDNNTISLNASVFEKNDDQYLFIKIHNTGINLKMVSAPIKCSRLPVTLSSSSACATTFEIIYSLSS